MKPTDKMWLLRHKSLQVEEVKVISQADWKEVSNFASRKYSQSVSTIFNNNLYRTIGVYIYV